jgi:hypothetical protein
MVHGGHLEVRQSVPQLREFSLLRSPLLAVGAGDGAVGGERGLQVCDTSA